MKIFNSAISQVNPYKRSQQQSDKTQNTSKTSTDQLEISSAAKSMQTKTTVGPERADRIAAIKADIDAGTYKVDARQLATNLINYYRK